MLWYTGRAVSYTHLMGASTTAVYYVTLKLVRDEDDSVIKSFFRSFTSNFKQATVIWLIILAAAAVLGFDFWFFYTNQLHFADITRLVLTAVFGGGILILLFVTLYVFPLQSRFYNPVKRTKLNAFFMSVRHLLQTLGMLGTDAVLAVGVWMSMYYVPQAFILFVLFGMPLVAFVNSFYFEAIFKRYMPKEERENNEMRPLFEDEDKDVEAALQDLKRK